MIDDIVFESFEAPTPKTVELPTTKDNSFSDFLKSEKGEYFFYLGKSKTKFVSIYNSRLIIRFEKTLYMDAI